MAERTSNQIQRIAQHTIKGVNSRDCCQLKVAALTGRIKKRKKESSFRQRRATARRTSLELGFASVKTVQPEHQAPIAQTIQPCKQLQVISARNQSHALFN